MKSIHLAPLFIGLMIAAAGCAHLSPAKLNACNASANRNKKDVLNIPFKIVDGRIYVEAKVNGEGPYTFAIDTGASGIGRADSSLTKALGLQILNSGQSSDGVSTATVDVTRFDSLELGGFVRSNLEVITRDYSSGMKPEMAISGIIGREFFADGLLTIDYPAKTLSFSRIAALASNDAAVVKYERPFRIPMMIGDIATEGNLDTGANVEFVMPQSLFAKVGHGTAQAAEDATLTNNSLKTQASVVRGPFKIGTASIENANVRISDRFPELMVGARTLQNFKILIDQRSKLIAICPTR